jgi:hypothetical protein
LETTDYRIDVRVLWEQRQGAAIVKTANAENENAQAPQAA